MSANHFLEQIWYFKKIFEFFYHNLARENIYKERGRKEKYYRDIHAKRHLLKCHISASSKARNFLKIAFCSYEKSVFGSFFFKSSKPNKDWGKIE